LKGVSLIEKTSANEESLIKTSLYLLRNLAIILRPFDIG
jgi:hypothetical protein